MIVMIYIILILDNIFPFVSKHQWESGVHTDMLVIIRNLFFWFCCVIIFYILFYRSQSHFKKYFKWFNLLLNKISILFFISYCQTKNNAMIDCYNLILCLIALVNLCEIFIFQILVYFVLSKMISAWCLMLLSKSNNQSRRLGPNSIFYGSSKLKQGWPPFSS